MQENGGNNVKFEVFYTLIKKEGQYLCDSKQFEKQVDKTKACQYLCCSFIIDPQVFGIINVGDTLWIEIIRLNTREEYEGSIFITGVSLCCSKERQLQISSNESTKKKGLFSFISKNK